MEEQQEFKRLFKEIARGSIRGVQSALRHYHNKVLEKERKLEKAEHKAEKEEQKKFRENLKTPGEKDYDFMLDSGRDISYHTLDPNTDLDKLKSYLDGERLQYCIRNSSLDDTQEIVFFTKDRAKVQRALEKSISDTLSEEENLSPKDKAKQNWEKEHQRYTSQDNKLGWTPYDDVNHEEFYRDNSRVYQNYEASGQIEMDGYSLPAKESADTVVHSLPLDKQVSLEKLKDFMEEYNLPVAFKTQPNGSTEMFFLFRTDKLAEQKAALKAAFLELKRNPGRIRKVRPTMKEALNNARIKEQKLLADASKKASNNTKDLGQNLGRGRSR